MSDGGRLDIEDIEDIVCVLSLCDVISLFEGEEDPVPVRPGGG